MKRKVTDPEKASKRLLDHKLNRLMRRHRRHTADWQLADERQESYRDHLLTWENFHRPLHNNVVAVTTVQWNGQTWWVVASRVSKNIDLGALMMFGMFAALFGGVEVHLQFCGEDPRTLGKPFWDYVNHPDGVTRAYVESRKDLAKLK